MNHLAAKIQKEATLEFIEIAKFSEATRYELAVHKWLENNGHIPLPQIAKIYFVSVSKLSLMLQSKISDISGVPISNQEPEVEILYSERYFEENYPKSSYNKCEMPYTLELYYFLKYPERYNNE